MSSHAPASRDVPLVRQLEAPSELRGISVILFSGGRGTSSIARALVAHPQVRLTVLVNAYDDGLSTGRLRRFVPGMLGPSDVRKNAAALMPTDERCQRALQAILEHRLPEGISRDAARAVLRALAGRGEAPVDFRHAQLLPQLSLRQASELARALDAFAAHEEAAHRAGTDFEFGDCSLGNLVFTGGYLDRGHDFNAAVDWFGALCESRARICNLTDGRNLVLVGLKADGRFLPDEASIVAPQDATAIEEIFLLPDYLGADERRDLERLDLAGRRRFLRERERAPEPNPAAVAALERADVIVYGPGTQHSSLFPSYLTRAVPDAIAANQRAVKVFIANLHEDHDIRDRSLAEILDLFAFYMSGKQPTRRPPPTLVTRLFAHAPDAVATGTNPLATCLPLETPADFASITARDWELGGGRHSAGMTVEEILRLVGSAQGLRVRPTREMVSIVVPALDEERSVGAVLDELLALRFAAPTLELEVVLVDGGSLDATASIARSRAGVRVYELARGSGRGAALRLGIEKARGNVIVFFPADGEYRAADVLRVVEPVLADEYLAVFGSRAVKCVDLTGRLKSIYGDDTLGYLVGKYGGIAISIASLLLYNRFVTDPLTTLKAFDASLLKSLDLRARGVDLEGEIVAKLCEAHEYILEVPVSYAPRTKAQGKKTRVGGGLQVIARLVTQRLRLALRRTLQKRESRAVQTSAR